MVYGIEDIQLFPQKLPGHDHALDLNGALVDLGVVGWGWASGWRRPRRAVARSCPALSQRAPARRAADVSLLASPERNAEQHASLACVTIRGRRNLIMTRVSTEAGTVH